MQSVSVVRAERSQEATLGNLMELYAYDFSVIASLEVDESGRFPPYPLATYWEDASRFPFLIRSGDRLSGFALLQRTSRLAGADWDMAEFFVLRKHRRAGVGREAARVLFAGHPGTWEVRQRSENVEATSFWRQVIGAYTGGRYTEVMVDDERWRGPVQRFTS